MIRYVILILYIVLGSCSHAAKPLSMLPSLEDDGFTATVFFAEKHNKINKLKAGNIEKSNPFLYHLHYILAI